MSTVRTTKHDYPREELNAMNMFYGGKRCVITKTLNNVQWGHMLDAALTSSNRILGLMLDRNLRKDRHPAHVAEVRENILPVNANHHASMDQHPAQSTVFLHEDILARTLSYEKQLQKWRISRMMATGVDPGRPSYEAVFGDISTTDHRYHAAGDFDNFLRKDRDNIATQEYFSKDCPGIDNSASQNNFPVLTTLLSIPFSLLGNLPRLLILVPISTYQQQLITMSSEIIRLWWWDPSSDMTENLSAIGYKIRQPELRLKPIRLLSATFATTKPIVTYGNGTSTQSHHTPSHQDARSIDLPSGDIVFDTTPLTSKVFVSRSKCQ